MLPSCGLGLAHLWQHVKWLTSVQPQCQPDGHYSTQLAPPYSCGFIEAVAWIVFWGTVTDFVLKLTWVHLPLSLFLCAWPWYLAYERNEVLQQSRLLPGVRKLRSSADHSILTCCVCSYKCSLVHLCQCEEQEFVGWRWCISWLRHFTGKINLEIRNCKGAGLDFLQGL